jgi:hypothetical protein
MANADESHFSRKRSSNSRSLGAVAALSGGRVRCGIRSEAGFGMTTLLAGVVISASIVGDVGKKCSGKSVREILLYRLTTRSGYNWSEEDIP